MKLILLIDGSPNYYRKIIKAVNGRTVKTYDTGKKCKGKAEFNKLSKEVEQFAKTDEELLIIRYSGNEEVVQELGDESPEMIITLSNNRNSLYYTENPIGMFLNLINIFENAPQPI